jgi:membrane protease YdiL (CAAX protease family)
MQSRYVFHDPAQRYIILVIILSLITFGIYPIYWFVVTKNEMNRSGALIPTAWLIIVPIANIWWMWKYSEGVEVATRKEMTGVVAFILIFLLGVIGMAIVQNSFNKVAEASGQSIPAARVMSA